MIELENVEKEFRPGQGPVVHVLRGVSLTIASGEMVAIRGASGSGKSTLLNLLGCLDEPTRGCYRLDGRDVSSAGDRLRSRVRARYIGFIFQSFHLLPRTTAIENVETPSLYLARGRVQTAGIRARARTALERVGLGHRLHHYPGEMSGGEQQRVAIARALINDPAIILADEPTGNLDAAAGASIMALIAAVHAEGRTVVLVTHDDAVAAQAQRQIHMRDGRAQEEAKCRQS